MHPLRDDRTVPPVPTTAPSSNQNQQPFQQQLHQQPYQQPYQQQQPQYQIQNLQPWPHHQLQQETAQRPVSQYGIPGRQAQVQGLPFLFSQQTPTPELPPRPALQFAPPPPQILPYNPGQHQTPGYQSGYAQPSQPSSNFTSQPHSFQAPSTSAQGTLGQQPPSSFRSGIGRIGASLSGLIQAKVQGYLDHAQGAQAPSPSTMPTSQASDTQTTQAPYMYSASSQPQSMHKPTTGNQHAQPSINSSGTAPSRTLQAHHASPYPTSVSNAGIIHNASSPASTWLAPGPASSPCPSPTQSHIQGVGDRPMAAPAQTTRLPRPPSNMGTAVQASSGVIVGATPSLVVPTAAQPQPESVPWGQVDTQPNSIPSAQSSVYPALSTPEISIPHPTSALLQPKAPPLELKGSKTPSPQVGTALPAQVPGVITPTTAQVQRILPAVTVSSIPPQPVSIQPPGQGRPQPQTQHFFIPPTQESQVKVASGPGQTSRASAPRGLPTRAASAAASSTPTLPQTSSSPTPGPIASRASKLPSLTNLAAKVQQKLVLEAPVAITQALGTDSIHDASNSGSEYVNEDEYHELPMLEGSIRASGTPGAVARLCFNKMIPAHVRDWYVHNEAPSFLICSWCHHNYIQNSTFASAFSGIRKKGGCSFHIPRMTKSLWPEAVRTGSLSAVTAFMSTYAEIPACKGAAGAVMSDHVDWFVAANDEIPNFVACKACYEGIIMCTSFQSRFIPSPLAQGPNNKWSCDMSLEFIWRTLLRAARRSDWPGFVEGANKRIAMQECKKQVKVANMSKWYCIRGESPQLLRICETCHADDFARSRFEGIFDEVKETRETRSSIVKCGWKFNLPLAQLTFSYTVAQRSPSELRADIIAIASKPLCNTKEGITGGKWYNFPCQIGNFGICEACYIGFILPTGAAACLSPRTTVQPAAAYCIFNVFMDRWSEFFDRYCEAIDIGVLSGYEDHVRKWSAINPCVRQNAISGRAWYGWLDCPICPDCYETFAADTSLAATLPLQNTYSDEEKACCMYSPRQRERYTEACTLGSAEKLLEASRERQAVWLQTIPILKEMKARVDAELEAARVQRQISANYLSTDMLGTVSGSNSYVYAEGGYKSWDGVMSDQAWNSAMAMQQRAANPARIQEMVRLEKLWAQYE